MNSGILAWKYWTQGVDGFFGISIAGEDFRTLGDTEICLRLVMKGVGILDIRDMMLVPELTVENKFRISVLISVDHVG